MIRCAVAFLVASAVCAAYLSLALADEASAKADAAKAADKWLTLFDKGDYGGSYASAAPALAKSMTSQQFRFLIGSARDELGQLVSRKIVSETYVTSVAGAPEAQYVVVRYKSSFQHTRSGFETVTVMLDKDGVWRVWNYEMPTSPFAQ
jgi:hypothetical protein